MVKMKKIFPKIIDVICFVGGSSIFTGALFDFKNTSVVNINDLNSYSHIGSAYYYSDETLYYLALGISLIVLGFLNRSWEKEK